LTLPRPAEIFRYCAVFLLVAAHTGYALGARAEKAEFPFVELGEMLPSYYAGRVLVVDVRPEDAYRASHIRGALPFSGDIDVAGRSVVICCASRQCGVPLSTKAALKKAGARTVEVLDGGYALWTASRLPTE